MLKYQKKFISASILSANFAALGEDINLALAAGADWIHFDVMDNHFVPNLTFGPMVCQSLRDYGINAPIDVHLMVQTTDQLIKEFANAGANIITIHPESTQHLHRSLQLIKDCGCQAGIAFNPASTIEIIDYIYEQLDLILIMSVNPGFAGQKFINSSIEKIAAIKSKLKKLNCNIPISIDGGIQADNIANLATMGVDIFVAGTSIFKADNYQVAINQLRKLID